MEPTILLIEDDPIAAKLVGHQLRRAGYQVLSATNGVQGLKMIKANSPDLLLLDLMLPGLDGFEVLNRLRADPQTADMPVIIVSAKSQPADKQMAQRVGADAYLTKPYDRAELLGLLGSLLSGKSEKAIPNGAGLLLIAPHGKEAASVALHLGLALASKDKTATVVDFRPLSVAHSLLLGVSPRPDPASLSNRQTIDQLTELSVQHPSGLRLLNNLEGTGKAGQFTAEDGQAVFDALLSEQDWVLADIPLYSIDVLCQTADLCAQMLLVTRSDPVSLGATRSAMTMIERTGVDMQKLGAVIVGPSTEEHTTQLGRPVLGVVPEEATPDDPAFEALADRLLRLE